MGLVEYLEKSMKLDRFNGTVDPYEHVEHVDTRLEDYHTRGAVKCKPFVLALKGDVMT